MRYLLPDVLATHFAYTKVRLEYSNVAPTLASEKRKAIFLSGFKEALKVNLSNAPLELLEGKKGKKKKEKENCDVAVFRRSVSAARGSSARSCCLHSEKQPRLSWGIIFSGYFAGQLTLLNGTVAAEVAEQGYLSLCCPRITSLFC